MDRLSMTRWQRLVCHCLVVEERAVLASIRAGASDLAAIGARCGAGTGCGSCRPLLEHLLAETLARHASRRQPRQHANTQLGLFAATRTPTE